MDTKICMFGLGVQFHDCYEQLCLAIGRSPDFLCDNSQDKWGKEFFGKECISPSQLADFNKKISVIITVRKYEAIYKQLVNLGLNDISIACFDRCYDYVSDIKKLNDDHFVISDKTPKHDVTDKWTFVTGASRGIGRQIALEMAKMGSNIIAHSRKLEHTTEVRDLCAGMGVDVRQIAADLGDPQEVEEMLDGLVSTFPEIDIVFNNAAISLPCGADPWNITAEDYMRHYVINTIAPIRICYRLIPLMIKRGFGRVVNVSSTIQKRPGEMAYACSKEALSKFVHDMTPSLEGTGVMMSLVCPGHVRSDMGGDSAPHPVESVVPGVLLGAMMEIDVNGRWFIAQDYSDLSLDAAINRAEFLLLRRR